MANTAPPAPPPPSTRLDLYDPGLVPEPAGLNNTGAICWMNSFLQGFASCSAVVRATFANREYLALTRTGRALYDFIWAAVPRGRPMGGEPFAGRPPVLAASSAAVLAALRADLRERRPQSALVFGAGQQSASEALVHILDMTDDPRPPVLDSQGRRRPPRENPLSSHFHHRYRGRVICYGCRDVVSEMQEDIAVQFEFFHFDLLRPPPSTPEEFARGLLSYSTVLEDYVCEKCKRATGGHREYVLKMIPEVFVVMFNAYAQPRPVRYFPRAFTLPAKDGGGLEYRQVAQIEHTGSLAGGHYIARAARASPSSLAGEQSLRGTGPNPSADMPIFNLNDSAVSPSAFGPASGVYMVIYHVSDAPDYIQEG